MRQEKKKTSLVTKVVIKKMVDILQATLVIGTACLEFVIQKTKLMDKEKAADVWLMFTISYDVCTVSVVQSLSGNT